MKKQNTLLETTRTSYLLKFLKTNNKILLKITLFLGVLLIIPSSQSAYGQNATFDNLTIRASNAGKLSFGQGTRQMLNLYGTRYGIGIQGGTQYFRTHSNFGWYKGGTHHNATLNPGGGQVLMKLNVSGLYVDRDITLGTLGELNFTNTTRQMINLWNKQYGIGIQSSTQYFRTGGKFAWYKGGTHHNGNLNPGGGKALMTLWGDGTLGVNTKQLIPGFKLIVNGKARAKSVRVTPNGWSDFVFYDDYKLPALEEVAAHIKEKGHLKDIPSAKEVEKSGIDLGEMDARLLQKIEELTLYLLEQNKRLKALEEENIVLKKEDKPTIK